MFLRNLGMTSVAILALATVQTAFAESPVLLKAHGIEITAEAFEAFAKAAIPPEKFDEFHVNEQRGRELLAEYYVMLKLAKEARDQGLDKDPLYLEKVKQTTVRLLAQERLDRLPLEANEPDYEQLAKEAYLADPEKFKVDERVAASHILVAVNADRDESAALQRVQEIQEKIKSGQAFDKLAETYSDDPSAKANKGNLGYFHRGQMVKPFEDAAFSLSTIGQISEPVRSQFGIHIIRLEGHQDAAVLPFDEVKSNLIEEQKQQFMSSLRSSKLAMIRADKEIEVDHKAVANFFKP